ncbi:divalent-cation tolerance protein CutA [Lacunimicrobium album]
MANSQTPDCDRFSILYVTTSDQNEARTIGRTLIERQLAACTNILPGMTSQYVWEGVLTESNEAVLLVKTSNRNVDAATQAILELHSYDVPCVICWSFDSVNPDYTKWLKSLLSGSTDTSTS